MALTFLTVEDIYNVYPEEAYLKLIDSDTTISDREEITVIEDVKGYLRSRYDVDVIFGETGTDRNKKLVQVVVDMLLYNLLSRLNNADIPIIRKERYDGNDPKQTGGAIGWLGKVNRGLIQPDLPLIEANQEDQTGNRVIYGDATEVKDENFVF